MKCEMCLFLAMGKVSINDFLKKEQSTVLLLIVINISEN